MPILKENNFYCANEAGLGFSIQEWNRRFKMANNMGLEGKQREQFLGECKCEMQCVECACIVGKRRLETKKLIENANIARK